MRKEKEMYVNPTFSAKELMMSSLYVPIFRKEQLAEYYVRCTRLVQLCG